MNSLCYVTYLVISFFPSASIYWLLLPSLPISLSGGWYTINLLCFSVVNDQSDRKSRSMRISLLQFAQALGICSGYLVGDLVFKYYGYRMVFAISIAVHVFAILYTIMKFPWDFKSQTSSGKGSIWTCVKDSMKKLKDSHHKGIIVSMCVAMIVCQAVKKADSSVTYLYTRHQYGWETDQYSVYAIIVVLCGAVGTSIIYPVLSYYLGVDDCVLGVVGSISCIDYHAVTGLASLLCCRSWGSWYLYQCDCALNTL